MDSFPNCHRFSVPSPLDSRRIASAQGGIPCLLARSIARRGQAPSWRGCSVVSFWRGASLDGGKPRRGVVARSCRSGEEHRSTGTSPVVAWLFGRVVLARSIARRGRAPSWRGCSVVSFWRGASLDGDKPRRGVVVRSCRSGEEHRSTGTSPVVAWLLGRVVLARSIARRGQAPSWRGCSVVSFWRGASLDGDKPRRGVVAGGCWRGASLDGDKPRRGGMIRDAGWRGAAINGATPDSAGDRPGLSYFDQRLLGMLAPLVPDLRRSA